MRDLHASEGLIESEEVSEDQRVVRVTFWLEVDSEEEARTVAAIAYWSGCRAAQLPLPTGGGVELIGDDGQD